MSVAMMFLAPSKSKKDEENKERKDFITYLANSTQISVYILVHPKTTFQQFHVCRHDSCIKKIKWGFVIFFGRLQVCSLSIEIGLLRCPLGC